MAAKEERQSENGKSILYFMGAWDVGGVERVTAKLANEWVRRGWKVTVFAFRCDNPLLLADLSPKVVRVMPNVGVRTKASEGERPALRRPPRGAAEALLPRRRHLEGAAGGRLPGLAARGCRRRARPRRLRGVARGRAARLLPRLPGPVGRLRPREGAAPHVRLRGLRPCPCRGDGGGVVVPAPYDAARYGEAVAALMRDEARLAATAETARAAAKAFTVERVVDQWRALLEGLDNPNDKLLPVLMPVSKTAPSSARSGLSATASASSFRG